MARYIAFVVLGCAFTFGAAAMVETHLQVSNPAPQVVAFQSLSLKIKLSHRVSR